MVIELPNLTQTASAKAVTNIMKIIYKLAIIAILLTATSAARAQEYCITEKLNTDMTGVWKGEDSYSLVFRMDKKGRTCVKLVEPNSTTFRKVRDIVVVKGEIRHLTYYTPSTDGYVGNMNIVIKGDEMKFHWFGSYENKQGEDTYIRKPSTKPKSDNKGRLLKPQQSSSRSRVLS